MELRAPWLLEEMSGPSDFPQTGVERISVNAVGWVAARGAPSDCDPLWLALPSCQLSDCASG